MAAICEDVKEFADLDIWDLGVDGVFHLGIRENVLAIYRAIKLICNRVIHGFESICLLRLI
jgi:hypothetical protein